MLNVFKQWAKSSYYIFWLGALIITLLTLLATKAYTLGTLFSIIGALAGFMSVVLIVNKKPQSGYVGMVSAIIYMVIAWNLGNYSDALLNILFIVFLNAPLILNKQFNESLIPKSIKGNLKLSSSLFIFTILVFIGLLLIEIFVFHAPRPFWSVIAASMGILASIMTSVFNLKEAFVFWSIQNILQVILYTITFYQTKDPVALTMIVTYTFYTINASTAFFNRKWFNTNNKNS